MMHYGELKDSTFSVDGLEVDIDLLNSCIEDHCSTSDENDGSITFIPFRFTTMDANRQILVKVSAFLFCPFCGGRGA
jgi:hypothetical protein